MWDLLLYTLQHLPTTSVALILVMAVAAGLIVNQILKVGLYTTLASIPALLFVGLLANAVLMINHVMLSSNKASNIVLSASIGFIMFAAICFGAFRVWNAIQDRR